MDQGHQKERRPRVALNKAGWRVVTVASLVVAISLLAALLAQGGLFTNDPGLPDHPDGLTTLVLVLAILAFFIQIFVFIFQTQAGHSSVLRSEELNAQTNELLVKIETSNALTEKNLISQFNRLLDYVVDDSRGQVVTPTAVDPEDENDGEARDDKRTVSSSEVRQMIAEANRLRERPQFEESAGSTPSEEDERVLKQMLKWPSRDEAEAAVKVLAGMPSMSVAVLSRIASMEIQKRRQGKAVGSKIPPTRGIGPATQRLIDLGLLAVADDAVVLTDAGRVTARMLPIGKSGGKRPEWWDEIAKPISNPDRL
jgi:hypothetical protein